MPRKLPRAIKDIRRLQQSTKLLCRKDPFSRFVRDIALSHKNDARFQGTAILALQEDVEMQLVKLFENCNKLAVHGKRVTVMPRDVKLAERLMNRQ